jgi:hypothetical protein
MKPVIEWDEEYILSLPHGEFDWLEAKGRKAIDLTLSTTKESDVLENLAKEVSAFANSGGGQLVFGLANPSNKTNKWHIDDGGVSTSIKGKISTKEWLEDIVPNLVEFPLTEFNVYPITSKDSNSQILPERALYIIDIADSSRAPHQSRYDNKYYARVAGKSRPISHRLVVDILGRRQYPKIELEFAIERSFIKGKPLQMGTALSHALSGSFPPEKDTNFYKLIIRARNKGKVYAQYVNSFVYVPVQLLSNQEVKVWGTNRIEKINGNEYIRYYEDNTVRDSVGGSGLGLPRESGPARYDPILPGLSRRWEITLQRDSKNLKREELLVKWTTHADNASPTSGEIKITDINVVDAFKPDFDAINEDDENFV